MEKGVEKKILTVDDKALMVLEALKYKDVDGNLAALGENIILKEELVVPLRSVMLARLNFAENNNHRKDDEYRAKWEGLKRMATGYRRYIHSVGSKVNERLGEDETSINYLRPGDNVSIDLVNNSFGIFQLIVSGNTRGIETVGTVLGGDLISESVINKVLELDNNTEFKNGTITIINYIKITYMHVAAKLF